MKIKDSSMNNVISLDFSQKHMYCPDRKKDGYNFKKLIKRLGLDKYYEACCVCDWSKCSIDLAHIGSHKGGFHYTYDNIVPLCPNHHRQIDRNLLNPLETEQIQFFLWNISNIICPFTE